MIVVFLSLTGNVRRFVDKLDTKSVEITPNHFNNIEMNDDFLIIVPTYDEEVTSIVSEFLDYKDNKKYLKGIVGSGDKNFAGKYVFNAKDISKKYSSPIVFTFEKSGTPDDIMQFERKVLNIEIT